MKTLDKIINSHGYNIACLALDAWVVISLTSSILTGQQLPWWVYVGAGLILGWIPQDVRDYRHTKRRKATGLAI